MQNRVFPIIHERKVQGLPLKRLRYRWAAMNPPANRDTLDDDPYVGSARLDDALAHEPSLAHSLGEAINA